MVLAYWLQAEPAALPGASDWWQGLAAAVMVIALLGALLVAARRGTLGRFVRGKSGPMSVESVLPLGERRSLVIVAVEGRRLLLGTSPVAVSLVTELSPHAPFPDVLNRASGGAKDAR